MKNCKTPLRYPGGKSRAMPFLLQSEHMPSMENIETYREGFIGGGSPAIAFAKKYPNIPIHINDKYYNLYCFWITLRDDWKNLYNKVKNDKQILDGKSDEHHKEQFKIWQNELKETDDTFEVAWRFFNLNKMSFSGLTETGGFSILACKSNWTISVIEKLKKYGPFIKDWKITNDDYTCVLDADPSAFVFLDPPYDIKDNLYGASGDMHSGFDHKKFYLDCEESNNTVMITYNSNDILKEWFSAWDQKEWGLTYTMRSTGNYNTNQKKRKELLLTNYSMKTEVNLMEFI